MSYNFGDVVLIRFPFTNQQGSKRRPGVIVSSNTYNRQKPDVILGAITGRIRSPLMFGETLIDGWQAAGLAKASMIKPIIFTAEKSILDRRLGRLGGRDQEALSPDYS